MIPEMKFAAADAVAADMALETGCLALYSALLSSPSRERERERRGRTEQRVTGTVGEGQGNACHSVKRQYTAAQTGGGNPATKERSARGLSESSLANVLTYLLWKERQRLSDDRLIRAATPVAAKISGILWIH